MVHPAKPEFGRAIWEGRVKRAGITFQPWIGTTYGKQRVRVLILGESHYGRSRGIKSNARFTKDVIKRVIAGEPMPSKATFSKLQRACTGNSSETQRDRFWNSVAFYNYVQQFLGSTRRSPGRSHWNAAAEKFPTALRKLRPRPNLIIPMGYRLWRALKPLSGWHDGPQHARYLKTGFLKVAQCRHALVLCIQHPSSCFTPSEWASAILQAKRVVAGGRLGGEQRRFWTLVRRRYDEANNGGAT
jgi:hypothetical protein